MHILANGAGRNLRSTIINHLKIRIMEKDYKDCLTDEELFIIGWRRDEYGCYSEIPYNERNNMSSYWDQFSKEEIEKAMF